MKPSKEGPFVIGLTGTIGSGKSVCSKILKEDFGLPVVDADKIAYQVVAPGSKGLKKISEVFGKAYVLEDGSYNRSLMRETVQNDPDALKRLNNLLHPLIREEKERQLELYQNAPVVIYDCPLLFEAEEDSTVDEVLLVTVDDRLRIQRLMERDKISEEEALRRISIQMSDSEKQKRSDTVIENNATIVELKEKLLNYLENLKKY